MRKKLKISVQCAKCPWKKSTDPYAIPNGYTLDNHLALEKTIAKGLELDNPHVMVCHESKEDDLCIGYLVNQLGAGNNISLRIRMLGYDLSNVKTIGEQHDCFEDTIPLGDRQ